MTESAPPPADEASAQSFGAVLRAARERAGMDVPTLAARLRLHVKQVEALERCDLRALPGLIYVRGFLRSCARELKIDPRLLLDDLERRAGVSAGSEPALATGSIRWRRFGDGTRPIVAVLLVVLVLAGLVGTLVPHAPPTAKRPAPPPTLSAVPDVSPANAPAPVPTADSTPASSVAAPAAVPKEEPIDSAKSMSVASPEPAAPAPAALEAPSSAAAASKASAGKPTVAEPPATTDSRAADTAELVLHIHSQAWIEVVQADGSTLLSQICAPGTVQTVRGKEPLHIVIGNSAAVEAQFRGVTVDLSRHTSPNGVARLTLE